MISSEVQRTLVKSPPELWAELSEPAALSRHLGELGEIRIVRIEPERTVEWEAENTTGTVSIKPSGWGTKVTLSVTREVATPTLAPEPPREQRPAIAEPEPTATAQPEPTATPQPEPTATPQPEPTATAQPEPEPAVELEPRSGFFARLFGRRRKADFARPGPPEDVARAEPLREPSAGPLHEPSGDDTALEASADPPEDTPATWRSSNPPEDTPATWRSSEPPDAFAAVRRVLAPETFAAAHAFALYPAAEPAPVATEIDPEAQGAQAGAIAAELMAAEEVAAEEVTAVLTAALDRLGAAHHRPFSRA
jgi:hypothetical protein